ncbi:BldC family transcriptional regulator [Actinomadura sp. 6N118]|uniref:BldC family transcriptional regulator n=1 Tax=Actinomadura sp. 6N118 TaxID=3375151 RepID=UPI0037AB0250
MIHELRHENDPLLFPKEIAALFRVDPKTVVRWMRKGKLPAVRTPGGHLRCRESAVHALLREDSQAEGVSA